MDKLLDSCILIDHFNDVTNATEYIRQYKKDCCISVITKAEVLIGFDNEVNFNNAKRLLTQFPLIELNEAVTNLVIQLRRQQIKQKKTKQPDEKIIQWKLPDTIQAATAIYYNLKLVTTNTKDFDLTQHPFIEIPYFY
jgi:predicted nucleic acid-binding protein